MQAIDESSRVTIKGTVHSLANAANDRGAAPDTMQLDRIHLFLKRSPAQETALQQLILDMHTRGSANYHKWLTPDQFGQQFGPADQDVATIESWLGSHGFQVSKVMPGKQVIEFSGNVAQMREAFHMQIHKYMVNGETHYANAADPQIPTALAPVVNGFASLNNFRAHSQVEVLGRATYDPQTHHATPEWNYPTPGAVNNANYVITPADFAAQYDVTPLYNANINGTGQSIAIVNDSNVNIDLVNQFRVLFNLPSNPPQVIIDGNDPGIDGINNPDGPNFDSIEAYLDVEQAGAIAPNATVYLVIGGDTALQSGLILAAEHAVFGNVAPVISLSFGTCEAALGTNNAFWNSLWEEAAAQGISAFVSSGDSGSAGCDNDNTEAVARLGLGVNGFASTPFNTSVGGTDFFYSDFNSPTLLPGQLNGFWGAGTSNTPPATSSLTGVIPEQPWNDSQYGLDILNFFNAFGSTSITGGGGGSSIVYTTKPAWQTGFGDTVRDIPDVSLFAANGANLSYYAICASDGDCQPGGTPIQITGVGGTSASSPAMAGIMALVDQKMGLPQGLANFALYALKTQHPTAFHDVTNGTNSVPCGFSPTSTPNCIAVMNPITLGGETEGQIGTGTTADFNAAAGYNEATGLGSIDANVLVTNWGNIHFAPTSTTLMPSLTSFAHGTSIMVSGTVTGTTPTGQVALMTDSTEPLNQGQAVFPLVTSNLVTGNYSGTGINFLPGGTYNIWGQYGGDTLNAESTSPKTQITVTPESSKILFNLFESSGASLPTGTTGVDFGTQLNVSAQVAPSSGVSFFEFPTGTVAFADNGSTINTAVLNALGDAEYNAPFGVGPHSVTAAYAGDNSYNSSSTASPITFTVVQDKPQIFVGSSNFNGTAVLTDPGQPTIVEIQVVNNAILSSGATPGGTAPVPIAPPTGTVTATFQLTGQAGLPPQTATLAAGVDPIGATSTGQEFRAYAAQGVATVTLPASLTAGTYTFSVAYSGDTNYAVNSTTGQIQVATATGLTSTTTANAPSAPATSPTAAVTVSGTVTGQAGKAAPTGLVFLSSSNFTVGEAAITPPASGVASTFTVVVNSQSLIQGANLINVQYVGDVNYAPSSTTTIINIANPLSDFSMIPETTIVPVTAGGSSSMDIVNVSSINGFAGAVDVACAAPSGITCSLPSPVTVASGSSAPVSLSISAAAGDVSGRYNVLLTGISGNFFHTLAIEAAVGASSGSTCTTVPPAPTALSATAVSSSQINLSWTGSTAPSGCAITAYNVLRGTAAGHEVQVGQVGGASTTSFMDTGLSASTTYFYEVVAVDTAGASPVSNEASATTQAGCNTVPPAPTGLTATAISSSQINLSWAASMAPTGCTITGYNVLRGTTSGSEVMVASASASATTFNDTGLTASTKYFYEVEELDAAGASGPSNEASATTNSAVVPSFTMSATAATSPITPPASTSSTITATAAGGLTGTVTFSVLSVVSNPAGAAIPPSCMLNPTSMAFNGSGVATSTLSCTTVAFTPPLAPSARMRGPGLLPVIGALAGSMAICFLLLYPPLRNRRAFALLVLAGFVAGMVAFGCGGSSPASTATTADPYTVTVQGMATGATPTTETTTVTFTVQ